MIKIFVYDRATRKPVEQIDESDPVKAEQIIQSKMDAGYRVDSSWEK